MVYFKIHLVTDILGMIMIMIKNNIIHCSINNNKNGFCRNNANTADDKNDNKKETIDIRG